MKRTNFRRCRSLIHDFNCAWVVCSYYDHFYCKTRFFAKVFYDGVFYLSPACSSEKRLFQSLGCLPF